MTWEEILNRAIGKEEEAYSNYHAMAKRASNPGTQTMFNELAEEEARHKAILTNWKSGKFPGCSISSLADLGGIGEGRDTKFARDLNPEEAVRLAIREEERRKEQEAAAPEKKDIAWGSQIRSYVLHPYQLVKDVRTGLETSNVTAVLDGRLDEFIEAYLKAS